MRTDEERQQRHKSIFGRDSSAPSVRKGLGQVVNDLIPMPPEQGPPLPRLLKIKWPTR